MNEPPKFVSVVRQIIPKEGLATEHPNRIKSRIKKALIKAGYSPETIRGVGQRLDDYAIVYDGDCNKLTVTFQPYSSLDLKPKKTRKSKGKGKSSLITGTHPSVADFTQEQFALAIIESLPETWQQQSSDSYRWLSIDVGLLLKTQYTVESAVENLIALANAALPHVDPVNYTMVELGGNYLVGVGPI